MQVFTVTEPLVQGRYWSSGYADGIRQETAKIKGQCIEADLDTLERIAAEIRAGGIRPVTIVNCITTQWTQECLARLTRAGIHPLLLTPFGRERGGAFSTVSLDFYSTFFSLFRYLEHAGRSRIALLALNPDSINDTVKRQAFADFQHISPEQDKHIFWNRGSLLECCRRFFAQRHQYDAVVCTNDVVAIKLIEFLNSNGVRVPEDCWVAAMGNTLTGNFINPGITVAEMDCPAIGRQAVRLYGFIQKNPALSSLRAVTPGRIIVRSSTANFPLPPYAPGAEPLPNGRDTPMDFYADQDVADIFRLETLFRNCGEVDRQILTRLLCGKTYAATAEEVFLSERAVKYRIRRMVKLAECSSRGELIAKLTAYMN